MHAILAVAFVVVPIAELAVLIKAGQLMGIVPTLGLLLAVSILGAVLVKREGVGVYRRLRTQIEQRKVPHAELLDAFLVLFAGALLLTPGFLTDVLGLSLLMAPVRAGVRKVLYGAVFRRFLPIGRR